MLYQGRGSSIEVYGDNGERESVFFATTEESFLSILEPRPTNQKIAWFQRYVDQMLVLRLDVRSIRTDSAREDDRLDRTGANFASWYRNVLQANAEAVPDLMEALRRHLPGFKGLKMVGPAGRRRELFVEFWPDGKRAGRPYELPLEELSDGQIVLVILYALLRTVLRGGGLLCVDEPDNYVALREIQPWLVEMGDVVREAGGQVMIISHHPEVIDYLAADSAWEFVRQDGGPARVRALEVDRESGLPASRWLIEKGALCPVWATVGQSSTALTRCN